MSNWVKDKIGNVADSFAGGTPSRSRPDYFNGEIPWISSSEVNLPYIEDTKEKITELGLENSSAKWIPQNSVLVAMYGATAGVVSKLLINATSNQAVLALVPDKDKIDGGFLYYQVKQNKEGILFLAQGSGQPNLSKDLIDNYEIYFPVSVPEQRQIATILSTADAVIEKTQAAIAKYKAIKQGMLQDLFTRGIDTVTGKLRPSYQEAPELYKESKLGWIPRYWEEERLGNRAVIEYGKSQKAVVSINGNIPVYGTGGLMEYATDFLFDGESILIGRKGTIDKPFYINGKFWTVDTAYYLSSFSGNIRWLHSQLEFYNLKRLNEATGVPSINREQLYNILLSFPEPKEQNEIVKRILSIDKKLQTEQDFLHKQQQIKAGLMHDLLSGEKQVTIKKNQMA